MKNQIILFTLAALLITSNVNAQSYSGSDLLLINVSKNPTISAFLNKQGFPLSIDTETAIHFAEKHNLLRDKRFYGSTDDKCKSLDFNYVDVGNEYHTPVIQKSITLRSNEKGSTKAEYQAEWDKIFKKLGKPTHTDVSREIWPIDRAGMIDGVSYVLNHNGRRVSVGFQLTTTGCLTASVYYSLNRDVDRWINEAREKSKPKPSAADAL